MNTVAPSADACGASQVGTPSQVDDTAVVALLASSR